MTRSAAKDNTLRLRFDKVATRLIERLRSALTETVPEGITVVLTVTAPIRLPAKTAAALEEKIAALVTGKPPFRDFTDTIEGNSVHIRLVNSECRQAPQTGPRLIAFVHNPDSNPLQLLNMTSEALHLSRQGILANHGDPRNRDAWHSLWTQLYGATQCTESLNE